MVDTVNTIDSLSDLEKKPDGEYQRWNSEITAAEKEQDKWRKRARKITKEYRAEKVEVSGVDVNMERKFNLFSANVAILKTALFNQTPEPSVDRAFKDYNDDVGRVACNILERALITHNARDFALDRLVECVIEDTLVPGVGSSWHTYHAEIETQTEEPTEEELSMNPEAEALEYDTVVGEQIKDTYVYWEDLVWSPCRCWQENRWIGRKNYMTRDALTKRFGETIAKEIPLDYTPKKQESHSLTPSNQVFQQAVVYEIWDKESKEIIWLSKGYEKLLDKKADFLELDNFFPCPEPLWATVSNGNLIPIPDYDYVKDQYRELNDINTRISLLVKACRVAGVYDKQAGAVQALLNNAAENVLVPVDQWAALADRGGIKGSVEFLPLDQIVATIDQLLKAREDVKQQIYEVTGMSDIIRGASKASETLGAQKIKAQYASMRIQDRQKKVVKYTSQVFNLQCQLMRKHMSVDEITKLAQVELMAEDPQLVQQAIQLIKDPTFVLRARVESDTLSDIDFQAEKQDRLEYMTTITNYLKELGQTISNDPVMGPFVMQLLQFSLAGFRIGKKFEGELDRTFQAIQQKLAHPQPPKPSPDEQKVQAQIQAINAGVQADQQTNQQELQHKQQMDQIELAGVQQKNAQRNAEYAQKQQQQNVAHAQKMAQQIREAQVKGVLNAPTLPLQ